MGRLALILLIAAAVQGSASGAGVAAGSAVAASPPEVGLLEAATNGEAVILLHGLARTSRSMDRMCRALRHEGYRVLSVDYPSTDKPIAALAEEHVGPAVAECRRTGAHRIHFVTHSLGGILVREYLARHAMPDVGRIVMLGPPNAGSEVVDRLGRIPAFAWINGPAGLELGTGPASVPLRLPDAPAEVGIVAGTRTINLYLSTLIPGPDDGKVSPERTKLAGMKDFATVPVAHPFLMRDPVVIDMTLEFLRSGRFSASPPREPAESPERPR